MFPKIFFEGNSGRCSLLFISYGCIRQVRSMEFSRMPPHRLVDLEQLAEALGELMAGIAELKLNSVRLRFRVRLRERKGSIISERTAKGLEAGTTVEAGTVTVKDEGGRRVGIGAPAQGRGMAGIAEVSTASLGAEDA